MSPTLLAQAAAKILSANSVENYKLLLDSTAGHLELFFDCKSSLIKEELKIIQCFVIQVYSHISVVTLLEFT